MRCRSIFLVAALALASRAPAQATTAPVVLDDFSSLAAWSMHPADGVRMRISSAPGVRGRAMRIDYAFSGGGWAIARRSLPIDFPANWVLSFQLRGTGPSNTLELKLVDSTGDNVWWHPRRDLAWPREWTRFTTRKRQLDFAWGPLGGGELRHSAAIEIAITSTTGGSGTVWIDELTLEPRPAPSASPPAPVARASSGDGAALAIDSSVATAWRSGAADRAPWLALDLGAPREIGGVTVDWSPGAVPPRFAVELSDDGTRWRTARTVARGTASARTRDWIRLPETETRWLRLRALATGGAPRPMGVAELTVQRLAFGATPTAFLQAVARDATRGDWPEHLLGVQTFWTVVGAPGAPSEGLLDARGMLEVERGSFSLEPFVHAGGRLWTWADAHAEQSLARGDLPIPTVRWTLPDGPPLALTVTAFADGGEMPWGTRPSTLHALYRLENRGTDTARATLYLAVRPTQVNPPQQFLNTPGGWAPVSSLAFDGRLLRVNGSRVVVPVAAEGARFGAATFDEGNVVEWLREGRLPPHTQLRDPERTASGALAWPLVIAPGAIREVWVAAPFDTSRGARLPVAMRDPSESARQHERLLATASWAQLLGRVRVELPPSAHRVAETIVAEHGWIQINRDGPAIQPGSRSYERSWIRDGALTSAALLRLGDFETVRRFIEWYAPFQYPNGKVPCCVDRRGADPVPENDSHGELIYLVAEYFRHTCDTALVARMWPHVAGAAAYMDTLRAQRMTDEYRTGERRAYFGLLPQSISHEGYSAKPMHSFWDQLFGIRGYEDAAFLARVLGKTAESERLARTRDEFRANVMDAYRATMTMHRIDWLAGAVELGDFDPTSTTIAVSPVDVVAQLPERPLARTFDRYMEEFRERRDGTRPWEVYTPYELRTVGTMVRLGRKAEAHELLDWFMLHQRPAGWRHWAEVVAHDSAAPRFLGDMPHGWVGSDYIRSVLDMFAFERERDSSLVVGAGITAAWARERPGVQVRRLSTHYGRLDLDVTASEHEATVTIGGALRVPPGGIVVRSPLDGPVRGATVNGAPAMPSAAGEVVVRALPARVVFSHGNDDSRPGAGDTGRSGAVR